MFLFIKYLVAGILAAIGFSITFRIPKSELLIAGISGSLVWLLCTYLIRFGMDDVIATFLASLFAAVLSRVLAFYRKIPQIVFLVPSLIFMVPGAALYHMISGLIYDDATIVAHYAGIAIKTAAAISIAVATVLVIPFSKILRYKE